MPKRYARKKRYRRRKPYRKRRKQTLVRQPSAIANQQLVKLRYAERISLDPAATAGANHVFVANDMYDPNYTGAGHQPLGFDEWMPFYNHFTVIGSKIRARFVSAGTSAVSNAYFCGIRVDAGTGATTDINTLMETTGARYRTLTNAAAGGTTTVTHSFGAKKFFGQKPMSEDDQAGTAGASPLERAFFHVFATNIDGATNASALYALVEIEYIAILHERKALVGSA